MVNMTNSDDLKELKRKWKEVIDKIDKKLNVFSKKYWQMLNDVVEYCQQMLEGKGFDMYWQTWKLKLRVRGDLLRSVCDKYIF